MHKQKSTTTADPMEIAMMIGVANLVMRCTSFATLLEVLFPVVFEVRLNLVNSKTLLIDSVFCTETWS